VIYLPWIVFLLGIFWMIRQGEKAKRDYLRDKAERARNVYSTSVESYATAYGRTHGQGQGPELGQIFGGSEQGRGSRRGVN